MAQLPPNGDWLMQNIGGEVILFHRHTEEEIVRFNPADADALSRAQHTIYLSPELGPETKCFAHMWSGYFYACAKNGWAG